MAERERAQTAGGLVKSSVLLTAAQDRAIDQLALERHASRAQVLRQIIDRGLKLERVGDAAIRAAQDVA